MIQMMNPASINLSIPLNYAKENFIESSTNLQKDNNNNNLEVLIKNLAY